MIENAAIFTINPAQQDLRLPFDILHQATIFHYKSTYHNNKTWGKTNNYCSEVHHLGVIYAKLLLWATFFIVLVFREYTNGRFLEDKNCIV